MVIGEAQACVDVLVLERTFAVREEGIDAVLAHVALDDALEDLGDERR